MAVMIPSVPKDFDPRSLEGEIFKSLQTLPDSFYIFHSLTFIRDKRKSEGKCLENREIDFLIFNSEYGLLCIEAKAGQVSFKDGTWYYGNGTPMRHGGPFSQANSAIHSLIDKLESSENNRLRAIGRKLSFGHAVWFPSFLERNFDKQTPTLDMDRDIILFADDLDDPKEKIIRALRSRTYAGKDKLDRWEASYLINNFLNVEFNILPVNFVAARECRFHAFLREQVRLLDYLEEQPFASINGAAGTGKTCIAVEKARRHAQNNEAVLFLCFNAFLRDFLKKEYGEGCATTSFMTMKEFVLKYGEQSENPFKYVYDQLRSDPEFLPFKHVIVDEGQDLGAGCLADPPEGVGANGILFELKENILVKNGSFFIFYDKNQTIQACDLPSIIRDSDCNLKLFINCRNTTTIAESLYRTLPEFLEGDQKSSAPGLKKTMGVEGPVPKIHFWDGEKELQDKLFACIDFLSEAGFEKKDIVCLTLKTEKDSCVLPIKDKLEERVSKFTTFRKFKGLESNAILVVDIGKEHLFSRDLSLYVAISRAKQSLHLFTPLSREDCLGVVNSLKGRKEKNKGKEKLARELKMQLAKDSYE